MDANTSGSFNTTIGYEALGTSTNGDFNVAIGHFAGNTATGSNNVFLGSSSGISNTGSGNVFLGHDSGLNETGSNKLYIDNSSTSAPLIFGDFSSREVTINDSLTVNKELGVGTSVPNSTLEVNGTFATKMKSGVVAGTDQPDGTGMVWRYSSGSGTITLPTASTCANRIYVIMNQTTAARTISSYKDLSNATVTSITQNSSVWLMSDGSLWYQIK